MQGGVVGGICLLSFLLSIGRTEELAGVNDPEVPQNIQDLRRREDSKDLSELDSSDDLRNGKEFIIFILLIVQLTVVPYSKK